MKPESRKVLWSMFEIQIRPLCLSCMSFTGCKCMPLDRAHFPRHPWRLQKIISRPRRIQDVRQHGSDLLWPRPTSIARCVDCKFHVQWHVAHSVKMGGRVMTRGRHVLRNNELLMQRRPFNDVFYSTSSFKKKQSKINSKQ